MLLHSLDCFAHFLAQTGAANATLPWWKSGAGLLALVILAVVLTWFIASSFSKSIRMPEQTGRIWTILLVLALAALMIASKWPPKFGVDLRGGINFVGQLNLEAFDGEQTTNMNKYTAADIIGVLSQRINPGGVSEIVIRALGADKIEVIIPEVDESAADEIWQRLVRTGHLMFRIVATRGGVHNKEIVAAEAMAARGDTSRNVMLTNAEGQPYVAARWYSLARENVTGEISPDTIVPVKFLPDMRRSDGTQQALVRDRQTGLLINLNEVPFTSDDPNRDFAVWLKEKGIRTPQVLMIEPREDMNVEGKDLYNINKSLDNRGMPNVAFSLRGPGVSRMRKLTTKYSPNGEEKSFLGIVIDDQVHSAPSINSTISNAGVIEGRFTDKEIDDLIITLQSGKIDVALNPVPISKQFVQSTLGEELKRKGIYALIVSYAAIFLFVMVYYQLFAGTVANLALFLNLVLTLAVVMAINQPLTLTGLAGMILTIGMAVDSNVLIYERIREELEKGASLRAAFRTGFERATVTIVDSNLTTVLAALILYVIGTEQLKGFAITLILGIVSSMFTAIFVSWTIFNIAERQGWVTKLKMMQVFPTNKVFDFLGKQRLCFAISILTILLGIVGMFSLGNKLLDIDLRGGSTAQIVFRDATTADEVKKTLESQDYKFRDEKVTFTATALDDKQFANRTFKIDSNVPSPDVAKGDNWKRLDEILEEVFKGKLELHEVKFDAATIKTEKATQAPASTPANSETTNPPKVGWIQPSWIGPIVQSTANLPMTLGLALLQETGTPPATPAPTETPAASQGAAPSIAAPQSEAPAATTPQTPEGATGNNGAQLSAAPTNERYRSKIDLEFKDKITGKSIRTMLVESSAKLDRPVEEDQVRLSSPDLPTEGSALATPLKRWTVELETNQPDDAKLILEKWSEGFNQQALFPTNSDVGGQVAKDAQWQAFAAIIASCIGIILYVWIRFQNVAFGVAGVVALIHDVLVTLAVIALTHYVAGYLGFALIEPFKINLSMIAALLTIIGYSINDTIVIFDRLREIRGKRLELTSDMVNTAVSQTLSRTFLTAGTTFAVVFILYLLGGETVHGFAFAMCVGVIVGTYSSVFIAAPIAVWMINKLGFDPNVAEQQATAKS